MPSLSDMETENAMRKLQEHIPENDYEGAKCFAGHPLEIVSEGYGLCTNDNLHWAWAFSLPSLLRWAEGQSSIKSKDGGKIRAWVTVQLRSREDAMDWIQRDINARRALPFDEERERARLMPV